MDSRSSGSRSRPSRITFQGVVICLFFVLSLSVSTISAEQSETSNTYYSLDEVASGEPIPVYITDDPTFSEVLAAAVSAEGRPFYGSTWITGSASGLGSGTLYLPINYQSGYLGVTSDGSLLNVSSGSLTGYFYTDSGSTYTVTMQFARTPTYRVSSGYDSQNFIFTPVDGNAVIADSDSNLASVEYLLPFVTVLFLGVIFVCLLSKSRR